jgi:glycosyltransferase involved in cell wall biosynthesis
MSRIDVLVTCYNYARYLRQCARSVLTQSHRDVRMLIVDDASSDETPAVCAELAAEDRRVEVLRHAVNIGHIPTYNECIARAGGEAMLILSADDFLLPGALARAASVLDTQADVGLVVGEWVNYREGDPLPEPDDGAPNVVPLGSAWFVERLAAGNFISTATAIVRTAVQKQLGPYRLDLPHSGDLEMWLRYALHSKAVWLSNRQAAYRRHDDNMSHGYDERADIEQCATAFLPHYEAIRALEGGGLRELRIREYFAAREAALAPAADSQRAEVIAEIWAGSDAVSTASSLAILIMRGGAPGDADLIARVAREAAPQAAVFDLTRDGAARIGLAASLSFNHYLAIDADTALTGWQIARLVRRLRIEPDRAHGLVGQRLELDGGTLSLRDGLTGMDAPMSLLRRVLAFSKAQAVRAQGLAVELGRSSPKELEGLDEMLLSCASAKPPLCHDLGEIGGESGGHEGGDAAKALRIETIRKLMAASKAAVFSPLSYRAASPAGVA